MVDDNGIPKGMKQVLEECGINTATLKGSDMRIILANHDDFKSEKTILVSYLTSRGHAVHFIPKFHCEMNPIERVWGQAMRYTRTYTNFTVPDLRDIIAPALNSVMVDNIRKFFRKACDYEKAYREGHAAGKMVAQAVKKYKSHRRIFF